MEHFFKQLQHGEILVLGFYLSIFVWYGSEKVIFFHNIPLLTVISSSGLWCRIDDLLKRLTKEKLKDTQGVVVILSTCSLMWCSAGFCLRPCSVCFFQVSVVEPFLYCPQNCFISGNVTKLCTLNNCFNFRTENFPQFNTDTKKPRVFLKAWNCFLFLKLEWSTLWV